MPISETEVELTIHGDEATMQRIREHVLTEHFADKVNIPGFRAGKAPANLIEKNVDQAAFQNQYLEEVVNDLFVQAVNQELLKTVDQPTIEIKKFVPYTTLEFVAKVPILGKVTLPDYKKIKLAKPAAKSVTTKDVDEVINSLTKQVSEKKDVNRDAKNGDKVWIDFRGKNEKGIPVNGADGKDYPLVLGSNTFIPGFEPNLIGLKAGDSKTFTIKFPKDYQVAALANRDVTFSVDVIKVQEIIDPILDDDFAAKIGPFKTMAELRTDIKKQLTLENTNRNERDYETALLKHIADKSKVVIPEPLLKLETDKKLEELKRNLTYRGQTFPEFLENEGQTEEEYIEKEIKPEAAERLKASIVLSEISELENMNVTNEEVEQKLQLLRAQYQDPQAQADLARPEAKRDIASRILAEKTVLKLVDYASK